MKRLQNSTKSKSMDCCFEVVSSTSNTPKVRRGRLMPSLKINIKKSTFAIPEKAYDIEDDYEILETVGVGAYSVVKSAIDRNTKNKVAIKFCRGPTSIEMLKSEYELLKDINHECIINVHDFLHDGANEAYLVMEYFRGTTLDEYIKEGKQITEQEARILLNKLFNTLSYLHSEGITHCDIKPENMLLSDSLDFKIIDFNTSLSSKYTRLSGKEKMISIDTLSAVSTDSKFSQTHLSCTNSPLYASPETQASSNGGLSESMDIWGAGIILFSMLAGTLAHHKLDEIKNLEERQSKILSIVNEHVNLSIDVKQFLSELLSKNSEDRPTADQALSNAWFRG